MPHYFFYTAGENIADADPPGIDLQNDEEARLEAVVFAGELIRDDPEIVARGREMRVEVRDSEKRLLSTVAIRMESAKS